MQIAHILHNLHHKTFNSTNLIKEKHLIRMIDVTHSQTFHFLLAASIINQFASVQRKIIVTTFNRNSDAFSFLYLYQLVDLFRDSRLFLCYTSMDFLGICSMSWTRKVSERNNVWKPLWIQIVEKCWSMGKSSCLYLSASKFGAIKNYSKYKCPLFIWLCYSQNLHTYKSSCWAFRHKTLKVCFYKLFFLTL